MALVAELQLASSSSSSPYFLPYGLPKGFASSRYPAPAVSFSLRVARLQHAADCTVPCFSATDSPFTERHSLKPSSGGGVKPDIGGAGAIRRTNLSEIDSSSETGVQEIEHDIANCLLELTELLFLLRKKYGDTVRESNRIGNVFLVGTGPGDPDLLTVKALRLMQTAHLVLYDRLVSTEILNLVHADARLLYVGKTSGYHSRTQDEIHQLLLSFAEAGATVLRLKGGDPLVFGRGGEEMDFLQQQGIHVQVIPGITAASGIAAELGIPLTHRGAANSVSFLTGHSMKGGSDPLFVAERAADPDSTIVVYMGLSTLPSLAVKLMRSGLPKDTPAVAVERGTTSFQRMVFAELQHLPSDVASAQLVSPTLLIIGRVVALSPFWALPIRKQRSATIHLPSVSI